MNTDFAKHFQNAFQERFGNDFVDVQLRGLPHEIHGTVRMKNLCPEMRRLAQSMEAEFAEMDMPVSIDVMDADAKLGVRTIFSMAWIRKNSFSRNLPTPRPSGL